MAALTRLAPYGFGARRYGSFAGRSAVAVVVGGLARKKPAKRWYTLPNGVRVLATDERFARLAASYEVAQKEIAEETAPAMAPEARKAVPAPETAASVQSAPIGPGAPLLSEPAAPSIQPRMAAPVDAVDRDAERARLAGTVRLIEEATAQRAAAAEAERARIAAEMAARIHAEATAVELARVEAERRARIIQEEDEVIAQLILAMAA